MLTPSERENYHAVQVAAFVAIALIKDGRWVGVFSAQSATPRCWSAPETELIRDVAERIWSTVQRARAEQELRASEARQAFLLRLSDRLRMLGDARELMRAAADMIGRHLGVASVQYTLVEGDQVTAEMAGVYNDGRLFGAREGFRFKLSDYGEWAPALRSGHEVFTSDDPRDARRSSTGKASVIRPTALLAIPLMEDGHLIAILAAGHPEPRPWADADRQLLRDVAARTCAAALRARAEATLRESEASALRANEAKDDFLATLSHELRTPLSAILLWAGALKSGLVPLADLDRAVAAILRSAQCQSRLIEDLLDLSRLTSGKLVLEPHSVVVESVACAAIELVQASAQTKGVELQLVVCDSVGAAVLDAARLVGVKVTVIQDWIVAGKVVICFTPDREKRIFVDSLWRALPLELRR
jgi:GAF domain-containing protein